VLIGKPDLRVFRGSQHVVISSWWNLCIFANELTLTPLTFQYCPEGHSHHNRTTKPWLAYIRSGFRLLLFRNHWKASWIWTYRFLFVTLIRTKIVIRTAENCWNIWIQNINKLGLKMSLTFAKTNQALFLHKGLWYHAWFREKSHPTQRPCGFATSCNSSIFLCMVVSCVKRGLEKHDLHLFVILFAW